MAKVSVLMPAYNAEKYIAVAIDSVIKQSFKDWELVIIDDCSTDATGNICDGYASLDKRIKVFHMVQNGGISKSKNEALNRATGEYIAFCDDDDLMEENSLLDNMKFVEEYDPQIVRWSYKTIKEDEQGRIYQTIDCKCNEGIYLSVADIFENYRNVHSMLSCDWTALYKKTFLDECGIKFNENFKYGGEDTLFNIDTMSFVNRMVMNPNSYYNWYLRKKHSTTAKRNINFCDSMIEVARREKALIMKHCSNGEELWREYRKFYRKIIIDYAQKLPIEEMNLINIAIEGI